jgi:glycosyltransferase involved in cell wall biosynthesis
MKILMIRATRGFGGAEVYNLNLIKGFKKYFSQTELIFLTTLPYFAKRIEEEGSRVKVLPVFTEEIGTKRGLVRLFFALPKYLLYYLKEILYFRYKEKIKIVCLQAATEKIVLTPLLHILGFKVIWIEHGPFFSFPTANEVFFIYTIASRFANRIITYSLYSKSDLMLNGIITKIISIKPGIDVDLFKIKPTNSGKKYLIKGIDQNNLIVGYLGDICKEKGIDNFIDLARIIIDKNGIIKFVLVGKGNQLSYIKLFITDQGFADKFIFLGFKQDVRDSLSVLDILFYPTIMGDISITLMEAMAMEKVVVTRDVGGNRELVVDGVTGFLFKNETPEKLADKIIWILKNKKLRKSMGRAARERIVEYFNQERWAKEMHEALANF